MYTIDEFLSYTETTPTIKRQQISKPRASKKIIAAPTSTIELVNYSERSFAIFGDTKPIKDTLQSLGGSFNRFLKRDGIPTPGYIFSITRMDSVRKALNI